MDDLKPRVDRLEWRVDSHSEQLTRLNSQVDEVRQELFNINKTLAQIKWITVGVAACFWASAMGFGDVLKILTL